ncbi:MAG: SEL1-like repeat protein [Rhodoferax sp.]|nr:SEL1-like repeat protein [Rhodoferax sp.]
MFTFISKLFKPSPSPATGAVRTPSAVQDMQDDHDGVESLAVLRQAVLTRDKKVAGYEFFQPDEVSAQQASPENDQSFLEFIEAVLSSAMLGKRRAFAAVADHLLFNPRLEELARAGAIPLVHVDPDGDNVAQVGERMQAMRRLGLVLGLADARVAIAHPAIGSSVSLGFLPVDQIIPPDLLQLVRQLKTRYPGMQLCARGVNTYEEFEVCRRLGMHGFIGPFVAHRRDWQSNNVDPGTLRLCKLLNSLRQGAEMDAIIQDIKLDPLLSYRILGYANSAAIGAQRKILSIKDAILLVGREPLFRWLVLLLCTSAPSHSEDGVLLENALARGRMMEMLARKLALTPPEIYFLTGVLSLLDVILQLPAKTLIDALDLPEEVRAALLERTGPYGPLLRLAEASEQAQTESVNNLCTELGVALQEFNEIQNEALAWARGQSPQGEDTGELVPEKLEQIEQADQPELAMPEPEPEVEPEPAPSTEEAAIEAAIEPEQALDALDAFDAAAAAALPDDPLYEAALQGEPQAQCALGARYASGEGGEQDFVKALEWYTKAAEQGNAKAQWNVAILYARGPGGITQDVQQAAQWCQQAADQGFAAAQATLGLMYANGQGVEKDMGQAVALLQQAADQEDAEAEYNLAIMHEQGLPTGTADPDQAFVWFSKAAEQGLPAAQERLGLMYAMGQAMEQDLVEAHKWFFIANENQHPSAKANLAHSLTLMEPDQVTEAQDRAKRWIEAHTQAPSDEF